jgi:hypothetical protein
MEHVEDLLERYVVANLASALRGGQQRLTGGDDPGAVAVEHGIRAAGVLEELGGDVPFGRDADNKWEYGTRGLDAASRRR